MKNSITNLIKLGNLKKAPKKAYYTYLLIDIDKFQKNRSTFDTKSLIPYEPNIRDFILFKSCIFYVGKGIALRKHSHLTMAKMHYCGILSKRKIELRISRISSLWKQNKGVTMIQLDCDATSYEAFTRENCIIKSLNFNNLTNKIRGTSYGIAKTWSTTKIINYGDMLLYQLFSSFLSKTPNIIYANDVILKPKAVKIQNCAHHAK